MYTKFLFKTSLIALGIALLTAGLFFQGGVVPSQARANPTSTPDRLAEPTLPASPSQADRGAQVYWLSCLPCHGDKGQGLTDEFRSTYPPEEQYCWERGCHGEVPYENGFRLPTAIPRVVGEDSLTKFANASQLNAYIRAAMPYWKPGSLTEEDAWRVTAFLLRANGIWEAREELNESNAAGVIVSTIALTPAVTPAQAEVQPATGRSMGWIILGGSLAALILLIFVLKKSQNTTTI